MKYITSLVSKFPFILLAVFTGGGTVMVMEIAAGNLISSYYGSPVYLWSGILGFSLLGLAGGYFAGMKLAHHPKQKNIFAWVLFFIALFTFSVFFFSDSLVSGTLKYEYKTGILASCFLLIFPVLLFCGMVCPLAIDIVSSEKEESGKVSGLIYSISTAGGVIFTFLFVFLFVPCCGIKRSILITSVFLMVNFGCCLIRSVFPSKK